MWESVKNEIFINKPNKYLIKLGEFRYPKPNLFKDKAVRKLFKILNQRENIFNKKDKLNHYIYSLFLTIKNYHSTRYNWTLTIVRSIKKTQQIQNV